MALIRIDYSDLTETAKRAAQSADKLDSYANDITREVSNKINNLPRGASANTNSIYDLATRKATLLRKQATRYRNFEGKVMAFKSKAENADKRVETNIGAIYKEDYKNLNGIEKIIAGFYGLYQQTIGKTEFGKFIDTVARLRVDSLKIVANGLKKAYDFFRYGKGRYVLNIVMTIGTVIGAVAALINPVTGPLAWLAVTAAAVALVVKTVTSGVTIADNVKALFIESDDPGAARYYGKTNSLESFAKKHIHDSKIQALAKGVDFVGTVADAIKSGLDLFSTSHTMTILNDDGTLSSLTVNVQNFNWDTLKTNLLSKFGFPTVVQKDANGNLIRGVFGDISTRADFSLSKLLQNVAGVKKVAGASNTLSAISNLTSNLTLPFKEINKLSDLRFSTKGFVKGELRNLLKHVPVVKDYVDLGYDGYSMVTSN